MPNVLCKPLRLTQSHANDFPYLKRAIRISRSVILFKTDDLALEGRLQPRLRSCLHEPATMTRWRLGRHMLLERGS